MDVKYFLVAFLVMTINAAWAGWSFHLYLVDGNPVDMVSGFVSAAVAALVLILIGKKL